MTQIFDWWGHGQWEAGLKFSGYKKKKTNLREIEINTNIMNKKVENKPANNSTSTGRTWQVSNGGWNEAFQDQKNIVKIQDK